MDEETRVILESIDSRLKWLLRLRLEDQFDEDATNKQKVKLLHEIGFETPEMAEIVGTSESSIRGTLSALRSEGEIE